MVPNDDGEGEHPEPVQFPLIMSKMYLGWRGEWRLKPLNGITTAPILSDDGGIRTARGYDQATGLWCENIPDVTEFVPAKPTMADAKAALAVIRDHFKTFCFADAVMVRVNGLDVVDLAKPPGRDESSFLASLLGAVCRASLWLAPAYLFRAAKVSGAGAGKGKAARCICNVAYGRQPFAIAPGGTPEELEKRVAAALLEGGPAVLFDNFNGMTLRSNALESALSERPARVRKFGTLDTVPLNSAGSIFITGNALTPGQDLVRRNIPTEFDARVEDAYQRKFPGDILTESLRQRQPLLIAALTIWRWGRQAKDLKQGITFGSFERWASWARDPLLALGCQDPVERLSEAKERDPERQVIAALYAVWWEHHGPSPQTAYQLDPAVLKIIDPKETGRQYVTAQLDRLAGTRVAGFVLIRHKGVNAREAATYTLKETGGGQSTDTAHDTHTQDGITEPCARHVDSFDPSQATEKTDCASQYSTLPRMIRMIVMILALARAQARARTRARTDPETITIMTTMHPVCGMRVPSL
jgi:hypothetical protein